MTTTVTNTSVDNAQIDTQLPDSVVNRISAMNRVAAYVSKQKEEARTHRRFYEERWIRSFDQNRGRYSPEERASLQKLKEKNPFASEAYIKITKTKALAAIGQIEEVLFSTGRIPISVEATPIPEGVASTIHVDMTNDTKAAEVTPQSITADSLASSYGYSGDGNDHAKGTTFKDLVGGLADKYGKFLLGKKVVEGESVDPVNMPELHPAQEAALAMDKVIQDQLLEADAISQFRSFLWELSIFGTGVIKGPFTYKEMCPYWEFTDGKNPVFKPKFKIRPYIEQVPIWNVYPDPKCQGRIEDCDYVIHEHRYTRSQLQKLKLQKGFDKDAITAALRNNYDIVPHQWDTLLVDNTLGTIALDRYDVNEYWGIMPVDMAREIGITDIPKELDNDDDIQVCIWTIGQFVLKAQRNPFLPERIPFVFGNFEKQQYQLWGVGVPENMEDAQKMINVHTRMAQDNLRLAGSCMLEINETSLAPNQDNTIYAGKVWRKQGGAPGQAVYSISFNNTAPSHLQFITSANQWADQATGIPSYQYGQTGIQSIGRTAGGLQMLMNSGNIGLRTVIRNIDEQVLKPLGEAFFQWNMQFNTEVEDIRGDVKIIARGTSLFTQKEMQSQRLLQFLQVGSNPALAPHINFPEIIKQLALSLDLDPDDVVLDMDRAKMMAELIGKMQNVNFGNGQGNEAPPNQGVSGGSPDVTGQPGPADTSGVGGRPYGAGAITTPGEASSTANH